MGVIVEKVLLPLRKQGVPQQTYLMKTRAVHKARLGLLPESTLCLSSRAVFISKDRPPYCMS